MTLVERILSLFFKHYDIVKVVNGETVVYLRRFFIYRGKRGHVYLHHILRPDDDPDPHSHPWNFTSFIITNGYMDETWFWSDGRPDLGDPGPDYPKRMGPYYEEVFPWTRVHRKAEHIHRVILRFDEAGQYIPAWTLVFTGPYRRSWTFVTKVGHVPWRKYLGISEDAVYEGD